MDAGGNIVDHHSCDFFPERWFDLVVVLQCDNTVLWNRLEKRGYSKSKIQENVQCEVTARALGTSAAPDMQRATVLLLIIIAATRLTLRRRS